jgi:pimeloyl-ACP methyl ester carboxylesterase
VTLPRVRVPGDVAIIILGAGLVHRVGPNRLTVHMARRLASRGHVVARFDHRGIGDSGARRDNLPFYEGAVDETCEVMDHLERRHGVRKFVLIGICSGAETALRTASYHERVVGAGLINGGGQGYGAAWDTYEHVRGEARHYLKNSLLSLDSWRRALTGRIRYRRLLAVMLHRLRNLVAPPKVVVAASKRAVSDVNAIVDRGSRILWLQSEGDLSQDYFDTMFGRSVDTLLESGSVRLETITYADHTLTERYSQQRVLELIDDWLLFASTPTTVSAENPTR